jgi:hypothetical protein
VAPLAALALALTLALSLTYRFDNVYQDSGASTRATWDGEAAAWMGHDSGVMDEGGQKKRAINPPGWPGVLRLRRPWALGDSLAGSLARWGCGHIAKTSGFP